MVVPLVLITSFLNTFASTKQCHRVSILCAGSQRLLCFMRDPLWTPPLFKASVPVCLECSSTTTDLLGRFVSRHERAGVDVRQRMLTFFTQTLFSMVACLERPHHTEDCS